MKSTRSWPLQPLQRTQGGLTASDAYVMLLYMTAHIYGRGQMVIPAKARKEARIGQGDVVLVQPEGNGRIVLTRLEKPQSRMFCVER